MSVRCEACSKQLGIRCQAQSFHSSLRTFETTLQGFQFADIDQSISDCEVVPNELVADDLNFNDHDDEDLTPEDDPLEEDLNVEKLIPLLFLLRKTNLVTNRDILRVQQHSDTVFFYKVLSDTILNAIGLINDGALLTDGESIAKLRSEQSLLAVEEVINDASLGWLVDHGSQVITTATNSPEDQLGVDLTVRLTPAAAKLFHTTDGILRIQSKSSSTNVMNFYRDIYHGIQSKNKVQISRNPFDRPLLVLNGQHEQDIIAAHAAYQITALVAGSSAGNHNRAISETISLLPPSLVQTMADMQYGNQPNQHKPEFQNEMEILLDISQLNNVKPRGETRRNRKSFTSSTVSAIISQVATAAHAALLQSPRSRFAVRPL